MARLRLFANLREAAGTSRDEVPGSTVGDVLDAASSRYGNGFQEGLATAKVWVNGDPAGPETPVEESDEIALIPPVSGGTLATPASEVADNVPSLALILAILIAAWIPLEWFVLIAVGAALAWLWDISDQPNAVAAGFNVYAALFTPVAAAVGAYAWGFNGFAGGIALGAMISISWPIFDPESRNVEATTISTVAGLVAGLGSAGLVMLRMISTTAVVSFVVIVLAGLLAAWLAQTYGSRVQSIDPNVGSLLGALLAGVIVGLVVGEIDTAAALLGSVAVAAGLIAGRALGSLLRRGKIVHTQQSPGTLTAFDGVIIAAPLFWLALWVFG